MIYLFICVNRFSRFVPVFAVLFYVFSSVNPLFADPESAKEVDELIFEGIGKNKEQIRQLAWNLTDEERRKLIFKYRRDNILPVALNVLLGFGIGSYLQGDLFGGVVGSASGVLFFATLGTGIVIYTTTSDNTLLTGAGPWFLAAGIAGAFYAAFEILRPIYYANSFNKVLYDVLKIREKITLNLLPYSRYEEYTRRPEAGAMFSITTSF